MLKKPAVASLFRVTQDFEGVEVVAYFVAEYSHQVIEWFADCDEPTVMKVESVRAVNLIT